MAQKFKTGIAVEELASASSQAIGVKVDGDSQARIQIDAGGKITWGSGSATGDATLYRSAANVIKTDDTIEAALGVITLATDGAPSTALANGALAVDTTNDTFYFRSSGSWQEVSGGGASLTVSDTAPGSPEAGNLWFESDTGRTFVYYADGSSNQWVEVGSASSSGVSGAAGKIQFSESNLFASDTLLHWDNSNNRLGIGTASPSYSLDVTGTARVTGAITASGGVTGALTGNADTATALANARTIGGTSFDGTANIAVALAATATALATARTIGGVSFDGTANINLPGVNAAGNQNTSGTAATVTTAAQTAITSVGTLTGLTVSGDLTVGGTTTTINSTTLTVDDKNIELGSVASPSDTTADGGGITLKGASDKTILWTNSTDAWHFNQGINVTAGNVGIGTTSPVAKLSVTSGSTAYSAHFGRYDDEGLFLHSDASSSHYNWRITTQTVVDQGFEIAASTAVGGTTWATPAFVIKANGNVGIGTTSPANPLMVLGAGSYGGSGTDNAAAHFKGGGDYGIAAVFDSDGSSDDIARIRYLNAGANKWQINYGADIVWSSATWYERMRLTSAGKVGIATATPYEQCDVNGNLGVGTEITYGTHSNAMFQGYINFHGYQGSNAQYRQLGIYDGRQGLICQYGYGGNPYVGFGVAAPTMMIHLNGGTAGSSNSGIAAAWPVHSSIRWKTNVADMTGGVDTVKALRPVTFNYKDPDTDEVSDVTEIGFIAEEVRDHVPSIVTDDPDDDTYATSVDYARVTAVLTAGMKEIITRLEALEAV